MKPSKTLLKLSFALLCSILPLMGYAQQDTSKKTEQLNEVTSLNKISIYLPSVALEREQKISRSSTLSLGINYHFTFLRSYYLSYDYYFSGGYVQTSNYKMASNSKLKAVPGANLNYRYYYNLDKRVAKNKNIANNSANYIGLDVASIFPTLIDQKNQYDYQIMITPNWGVQRNASLTVNGEFAIGPSLVINPYETLIGIGLKAGFSFRF
ncbi:hypothetical protein [Pedobacter sp.]